VEAGKVLESVPAGEPFYKYIPQSEWFAKITRGASEKEVADLKSILNQMEINRRKDEPVQCVWMDALAAWILRRNGVSPVPETFRISQNGPADLVPEKARNLPDNETAIYSISGEEFMAGKLGIADVEVGDSLISWRGKFGHIVRVVDVVERNGNWVLVIADANRMKNGRVGLVEISSDEALRAILGDHFAVVHVDQNR
jgi:hypothetical protein